MSELSLDELLGNLTDKLGPEIDKEKMRNFPADKQKAALEAFCKTPTLQVGDCVMLNDAGLKKYHHPQNGRVAVVSEVFPSTLLDEEGKPVHGCITCAFDENEINSFAVDFRYYKRV